MSLLFYPRAWQLLRDDHMDAGFPLRHSCRPQGHDKRDAQCLSLLTPLSISGTSDRIRPRILEDRKTPSVADHGCACRHRVHRQRLRHSKAEQVTLQSRSDLLCSYSFTSTYSAQKISQTSPFLGPNIKFNLKEQLCIDLAVITQIQGCRKRWTGFETAIT